MQNYKQQCGSYTLSYRPLSSPNLASNSPPAIDSRAIICSVILLVSKFLSQHVEIQENVMNVVSKLGRWLGLAMVVVVVLFGLYLFNAFQAEPGKSFQPPQQLNTKSPSPVNSTSTTRQGDQYYIALSQVAEHIVYGRVSNTLGQTKAFVTPAKTSLRPSFLRQLSYRGDPVCSRPRRNDWSYSPSKHNHHPPA